MCNCKKFEPQQPEGELVPNPYPKDTQEEHIDKLGDKSYRTIVFTQWHLFNDGSKAQLAFMLSQGYRKLPSEDELALWLCNHLSYTSRGLAQMLLERLLGEGHE
jgi:hypothetical protein